MSDIETLVNKLRASPKPKYVRAQTKQFDSFCRAFESGGVGSLWLSKQKQYNELSFESILIEMTPEMQNLLQYIYSGEK